MPKTDPIFTLYGWSVEYHPSPDGEEYEWIVLDRDGDEFGCELTCHEAIELCQTHAIYEVKYTLYESICSEIDLDEVSLETLRQAARLLGLEVEP